MKRFKISIRKTTCRLHPYAYKATIRGLGASGWGDTPDEACECLQHRLLEHSADLEEPVSTDQFCRAFARKDLPRSAR